MLRVSVNGAPFSELIGPHHATLLPVPPHNTSLSQKAIAQFNEAECGLLPCIQ
jgi:hypothetical protein